MNLPKILENFAQEIIYKTLRLASHFLQSMNDQVAPTGPFQMTDAKLSALPNVHATLRFLILNLEYGLP